MAAVARGMQAVHPMQRRRSLLLLLALFTFALAALAGCQNYDRLVEANATADQKWADVEAQLQRRYDLIPNLVNTVKASAKHEEETLTKVIEARAAATS